jgi:murein L,D-transpeptidase YcbB/YkuD
MFGLLKTQINNSNNYDGDNECFLNLKKTISLKHYYPLLFLFFTLCVIGCDKCSLQQAPPVVLVEKPERVNEEVTELLQKQIGAFNESKILIIEKDSLLATKLLIEFYKKNKFNVVWTDKGKLIKQGDTLFNILKNADDYGLIAKQYHFAKIDNLINTAKDTATKEIDAEKVAEAELLLTDAFFTFAVHVSKGRLNIDSLVREWKLSQLNINIIDQLNSAIKQNTIRCLVDSIEPQNSQYQALKQALKNFKFEFKNSNWDSIASRESDSVTFNDRLKKRLVASHDYVEIPENTDSVMLLKAIRNFQCKHNLTEDGRIGKLTFVALQRTKQDYIHQIQLNMERWRMYNAPEEKRFVWVNVPKYEMRVFDGDTLVMRSRVIVGKPEHQTPVLKSTIRYFLIYPYWNVPYKIATEEMLPILKRDTSYLRKKNFDVLDGYGDVVNIKINWRRYTKTYFPWRLRQRMGDDNSLGVLKFNFENKYGVYLHDTNGHRLFNKEMRALSHGCVRLERFYDFARFLIRDNKRHYPDDSLKMDLLKEKQKYVYIKRPIPIYINYFTAEVNEYNELYFYMDVYARDEKMLRSITKK